MVLTRAFACATPVVASDIPGYRDVMTTDTGDARAARRPAALADAVAELLEDEPRRRELGAARAHASRRSATPGTRSPRRLVDIYERRWPGRAGGEPLRT